MDAASEVLRLGVEMMFSKRPMNLSELFKETSAAFRRFLHERPEAAEAADQGRALVEFASRHGVHYRKTAYDQTWV